MEKDDFCDNECRSEAAHQKTHLKRLDAEIDLASNNVSMNAIEHMHMQRILDDREYYIYREALRICDEGAVRHAYADLYRTVRQALQEKLQQTKGMDDAVDMEDRLPQKPAQNALSICSLRLNKSGDRLSRVERLVKRHSFRHTELYKDVNNIQSTAEKIKALVPLIESVLVYNKTFEPDEADEAPSGRKKPHRKRQLSSLYSLIYDTY